MTSFKDQRQEKLRELLDEPQIQDGELVQALSDFLEGEIAAAYGRGVRYAQQAGKSSAPRAGRFQPKGRTAERAR